MKTIKNLFVALLLLCATVASAHDFEVEGIYYTITDATNKTVAVTYRGNNYTSYSNEYSGAVIIPESVAYNGNYYGVTSIGASAFHSCSGLTSIEIPNSVTSIGSSVFYQCTSLTNVEIGNSVTNIGEYAFFGCSSLINVEVGNSVTNIGDAAFRGCSGLTSITVETGNTKYDSRDNCNAIIETQTNTLIAGCQNTIIPNSVTSIGKYSFYGCTSLTSIVIPNSITSIVNYAFYDCTGLKTVVNFSNLTFSKGKDSYGYIAFYANNVINTPNGFVENDFVWDCSNDKNTLLCYLGDAIELTLPIDYNGENYVIGSSAFDGCSSLTSITIPNSVTSIESYAFKGCTSLKDLCIEDGDSILSLGHNLIGYTELYYSKTGEGLFYDCPLETLYLRL